ncbi:zinc finger and BTB domain-containing protein 38 [Gouania willdenowi]|uniref:zinc finger and BTB domain-containing protein 38 n=1 Tax=Gouania willdenowi TaxID=441366 RepID=UPI001056AB3C|nr:zinc finger and BTB domain-containing protein 38 [Gouania willdenowi]XP_028320289.1 zinc finger and BTB domain-containing protein 38 [Gouania willdenowi]
MTVVSPSTQNLMDSTHPHTVLSKLNEQRCQGLFCDVIVVVEDVKFRAHKNILAACSGYFKKALTTSEKWSTVQVLELLDLKSDVFASILNFIYCSKVTSSGTEDTRNLVAAGKKLGIPFLERLTEQERQHEIVKLTHPSTAPLFKKTKKEVPRLEDIDCAREPRITNAFSITEECPGNSHFTPQDQKRGERESPDAGQLPSNCPTTSYSTSNETRNALSEHSYALSTFFNVEESDLCKNKNICKPVSEPDKQIICTNTGPLKKQQRWRGPIGRSILPKPAESQTNKPNTTHSIPTDGLPTAPFAVNTPPPIFSKTEMEKPSHSGPPSTNDTVQVDVDPPNLSPQTEDSILVYSCEQCPEIFTNKALLTKHLEVHKKRFVSHLFCKFCHKTFIHPKRLRNHEQVCPKAMKDLIYQGPSNSSANKIEQPSEDELDQEQLTSTDQMSKLLQLGQSEAPQKEKALKLGSNQRRYNCSMCKRVYLTLSSLKRHENVHSWQRAYPCHYCNKVFALAEYRTKHEIWHTGERRYQCIFCLETFMTYYILKNHQKSFHGIDPNQTVRKKSANGGLKASVYPLKLYRLLPMKFRKKRYKTYSQTYSEDVDSNDQSSVESKFLVNSLEENNVISNPDTTSFPLTFMATTTMVSSVMPRITVDKPYDQNIEHLTDSEIQGRKKAKTETEDAPLTISNMFSNPNAKSPTGYNNDPAVLIPPEHVSQNIPFLKSLNTVKKLGELSASAKTVDDMTNSIHSSTESLVRDKTEGKTETYIAKPACPGPSMGSDAMPFCQITVKIGNEAIIRRQIKGSKLFPRKKRRNREMSEEQSPRDFTSTMTGSESPRCRLKSEDTPGNKPYHDHNDLDTADELWRPYYSYKSKKKRKKLKYKHRKALFHHYNEALGEKDVADGAKLDQISLPTDQSISSTSSGPRQFSTNCSPRASFNCDICDSSFITETGLRAHVTGSHPCFCRSCGKQGPPSEAPVGGDFVCSMCMENGSCFDNASRSPNPEKKYHCSYCPQRFLYLATKRSHEKKHQEANHHTYDGSLSCSKNQHKDDRQPTVKTEDDDNQESNNMECEKVEQHFSIDETTEETTDPMSPTAFKGFSYAKNKSPLSLSSNSQFSETPLKMKDKTPTKMNMQNSLHVISKKQSCDIDGNKGVINSFSLLKQNDPEAKRTCMSTHVPEQWVCKEETLD